MCNESMCQASNTYATGLWMFLYENNGILRKFSMQANTQARRYCLVMRYVNEIRDYIDFIFPFHQQLKNSWYMNSKNNILLANSYVKLDFQINYLSGEKLNEQHTHAQTCPCKSERLRCDFQNSFSTWCSCLWHLRCQKHPKLSLLTSHLPWFFRPLNYRYPKSCWKMCSLDFPFSFSNYFQHKLVAIFDLKYLIVFWAIFYPVWIIFFYFFPALVIYFGSKALETLLKFVGDQLQ